MCAAEFVFPSCRVFELAFGCAGLVETFMKIFRRKGFDVIIRLEMDDFSVIIRLIILMIVKFRTLSFAIL